MLNLTDTVGDVTCGEFASVFMKSRASTGINAALKDRTSKKPVVTGLCPVSKLEKAVKTLPLGTFATSANASPGDTVEYKLTYTNSGPVAATNVVITDPVPAGTTYLSCTGGTSCGAAGGTVSWNVGTVGPGEIAVVTFRALLNSIFPNGLTEIKNIGSVTNAQEPTPTLSNEAKVNVTAAPKSELAKAVRAYTGTTPSGTYAASATAVPGNSLDYRLTYTNTGSANATGVKITEPIPANTTFLGCDSGCVDTTTGVAPTAASTSITWNLGTVAPNDPPRVVTFQVKLDAVFAATSTQVKNTAVAKSDQDGPKPSNEVVVTVTATPALALRKEADKTVATAGGQVTYTLTASNGGNAWATGVTVTEEVPAGTEFVSCTGNCTRSGTTVTWALGTVKPGDTPSVSLTVKVLGTVGCQVCNVAKIASPSQAGGAAINSNQVCIEGTPGPNPAGAHASGNALAAKVDADSLRISKTISPVSSTQTGVGADSDADSALSASVPQSGDLLTLGLLSSTSASRVTTSPARAQNVSTAETADVKVLKGPLGVYAVTADVVQAVARTDANGGASSFSAAGSTITGLRVAGLPVADIAPNTRIELSTLFGIGAYVVVNEQVGSTSGPAPGQASGGTYAADLKVNMIRVHVNDTDILKAGNQVIDIVVSAAVAHSDFPQTQLCKQSPLRSVSGHAFIASETTDPSILPVLAGVVEIPTSGGTATQGVASVGLPAGGPVVSTGIADSKSTGTVGATTTSASSYAQAANACVLRVGTACTVGATTVRSQSNSGAGGGVASSNDSGTVLVGLQVAGVPIAVTPRPNTTIRLPGIGFVVLNEQTCDNGSEADHTCAGTTHSGLTVRAIHVVVTRGALGLLPGADIVVAEAHSDATAGP